MKIPRPIQWAATLGLLFLALFTVLRILFYLVFHPSGTPFPASAFWMGFKFDARFASFIALGALLLSLVPPLNPFRAARARRFWVPLLVILTLVVLLVYTIDFYHYDYLQQRLTASSLTLLKDAAISAQMVWQSYPVVRLVLALVALVLLAAWGYRRFYRRFAQKPKVPVRRRALWYTAFLLLLLAGIWGSVSQFALRWSNAFSFNNNFEGQLALTPFETFLNTLKFRGKAYDRDKVTASYDRMAAFLGVDRPDKASLNFERVITPAPGLTLPKNMNVVLVICESFSAYKSSMWGNPLNTTPYFKSLCDSGVFFRNCFTPSHGTARGVWATLTGLPDAERLETSSRNPAIVDQHILINDFAGYSKYYFIGGSASWANIRGLLNNNIAGLNLVEQGDLEGEQIDVWGISDKNLLLQAASRLGKEQKPFFAVIQTADNHRPYTIPEEDLKEFKKIELPDAELHRNGFGSNGELNAFRYTDFCFRKFMETARTQRYFDNTLFVFVGDHGVKGDVGKLMPEAWATESLEMFHVPLLFYAPKHLPAAQRSTLASQADILPSITSLAGVPARYTAMGKNLFDSARYSPQRWKSSFVFYPNDATFGYFSGEYFYHRQIEGPMRRIVSLTGAPVPGGAAADSMKRTLDALLLDWWETNRYLLHHNGKR